MGKKNRPTIVPWDNETAFLLALSGHPVRLYGLPHSGVFARERPGTPEVEWVARATWATGKPSVPYATREAALYAQAILDTDGGDGIPVDVGRFQTSQWAKARTTYEAAIARGEDWTGEVPASIAYQVKVRHRIYGHTDPLNIDETVSWDEWREDDALATYHDLAEAYDFAEETVAVLLDALPSGDILAGL